MSSMDQANFVVCLGRVIRELNRGEDASSDAEGLAWQLLQCCEQGLPSISSPHTLANLAWSLARLDGLIGTVHDVPGLMQQVIGRALELGLESFAGRDVAILLWAAATLHRKDPALLTPEQRSAAFRSLTSVAGLSLPEVAPQGLAMLLWALAVLDSPGTAPSYPTSMPTLVPRPLFKLIAEAAGQAVTSLSSREVANVVWSFATMHVQMPPWLVAEVPGRAAELRPQECANVLWAFASASESLETVVSALPCSDPGFLESWKPQEMANAAWALAHGYGLPSARAARARTARRDEALASVRAAIVGRVGELNGLELAMVARTLGSGEAAGAGFLAEVSARALALLEQGALAPDGVVQVADALAAAGAEVPEPLAAAWATLGERAHNALEGLVGGTSPEALDELQSLGLTTVGAPSTKQLLLSLGLAEQGGEGTDAGRPGWPDGLATSTQVLCLPRYQLLFSGLPSGKAEHEHRTLVDSGRAFASGSEPEARGLGLLIPVVLRFSRDRDAEFLALTAVVAEARTAAAEIGAETWDLSGTLQLHVSYVPCLSCIGAMLQFRQAFPSVKLHVTFDCREFVEG